MKKEEEIEPIFARQLENLGVDFIDYYLLHNFQTVYYDGVDETGGVIKICHLFDHALKWKEDGKIRHLGISFHSSADLLDRILTEHPESEFVQSDKPSKYQIHIKNKTAYLKGMQFFAIMKCRSNREVFLWTYGFYNIFLRWQGKKAFTRAAETLRMTQPLFSRQLKDLEDELGKKLLIRGSKKVTLTEDRVPSDIHQQ